MDKDTTVIIGGGLQGLATAYCLLHKGEKVLLLERNEDVAREASFANAGMITPSHSTPWNSFSDIVQIFSGIGRKDSPMLLNLRYLPSMFFWGLRFLRNSSKSRFLRNSQHSYQLAKYSKQITKETRLKNGLSYDDAQNGTMKIFRDKSKLDQSIEITKKYSDSSIGMKILDQKGVVDAEPALADISDQLAGGILYPEDEIGDAYKFCKELENLIRTQGGRIHVNTEIKKILVYKNSINGLLTDRVEIRAKAIVLAAGSWSREILKQLKLNLPVRPVKGYSLTHQSGGLKNCPEIAILDESTHTAITPLGKRIRVTGVAEFTGLDDDIHIDRVDYLNNMLLSVYPKLYSQLTLAEGKAWCGFRPMSYDGLPYIGETKIKGLYVNVGQGHLGWTKAMGSASLLSDIMLGNKTAINPKPYLANRSL